MDRCNWCMLKGDIKKCELTECSVHESWYSVTLFNSIFILEAKVKELEERDEVWREKKRVLENNLAKQEAEIKRLKQTLRSSMNELLADSISPEVGDYFDYVKKLEIENTKLQKEIQRLEDYIESCLV